MEHASHETQSHTDGHAPNLNRTAFDATVHCLTGCAIGEILGLVIATAIGLSDLPSIVLSIVPLHVRLRADDAPAGRRRIGSASRGRLAADTSRSSRWRPWTP
jgi:hypothetical protein